MKTTIVAIAKRQELLIPFGLEPRLIDAGFIGKKEFDNRIEATYFLNNVARENRIDAFDVKFGSLTINGVTAFITD